jgi:hypothetical protein
MRRVLAENDAGGRNTEAFELLVAAPEERTE